MSESNCPMCPGHGFLLGVMGTTPKLRCRDCGWVFDGDPMDPMDAPVCEECGIAMPGDKEDGDLCDDCAERDEDVDCDDGDDGYALASIGWGTDEDYGHYGGDDF